jgi:hypothetical protein
VILEGVKGMKKGYGVILFLVMVALVIPSIRPCSAQEMSEEKKEDIWKEGEPRGPRRGPGPGRRRFELTDEEIDQIMKGLKERDPAKAKKMVELREKEPEKFRKELSEVAFEEFGKVIRERIEKWREKRRAEFVEWLEKNFRKEANELRRLKKTDPNLYNEKFDLIREILGPIQQAERRNPELGKVLKEDYRLKKRRDELVRRLKATKDAKKKKQLGAQLEEAVAIRFDLIVRRKQIAYEHLLKRLEELKKRIEESRDDIIKWRDDKFKAEEVRKRIEDLTK